MEIKPIEYAYFFLYGDRTVVADPQLVESTDKSVLKKINIPKDAEGLYVKALSRGISPIREKLLIEGAVSKKIRVEGSPFFDIQFEDRYVGSLELEVVEAGEIVIPSKLVKASISIDMGSKVVLAGAIKRSEIRIKRTSMLEVKMPLVDCIVNADVASITVDIPGEEFYIYSSVWNVKAYRFIVKIKDSNEGMRVYSSHFNLLTTQLELPKYLIFTDTQGSLEASLVSSHRKDVTIYRSPEMIIGEGILTTLSGVKVMEEPIHILWHSLFLGELHIGDRALEESVRKGNVYIGVGKNITDGKYFILADLLGHYGTASRCFVPFDIRIVSSLRATLMYLTDIFEEETPIGNFVFDDGKSGISFSVVYIPFPMAYFGGVIEPDDYVIVTLFSGSCVYKFMIAKDQMITLMKGWNIK